MQLAKHVKFREKSSAGSFFETRSEKFSRSMPPLPPGAEIAAGHDQKEIAARLADRFSGPPRPSSAKWPA